MKRCVHQQRRGNIMRLCAVTVNFFFCFTACLSGPNCLILLTISSGRRTIANAAEGCKSFCLLDVTAPIQTENRRYSSRPCSPLMSSAQSSCGPTGTTGVIEKKNRPFPQMCLQYLFDMAGQEIECVAPFVAVAGTADANLQTKKNPHISAGVFSL